MTTYRNCELSFKKTLPSSPRGSRSYVKLKVTTKVEKFDIISEDEHYCAEPGDGGPGAGPGQGGLRPGGGGGVGGLRVFPDLQIPSHQTGPTGKLSCAEAVLNVWRAGL